MRLHTDVGSHGGILGSLEPVLIELRASDAREACRRLTLACESALARLAAKVRLEDDLTITYVCKDGTEKEKKDLVSVAVPYSLWE